MNLQGQDGELRLIEFGETSSTKAVTLYLEILFCEMDFSAAISRPRADQRLIQDRNKADTNMHYALGPDTPRYEPIPMTFSAKIQDTTNSWSLSQWLSGNTTVYTTIEPGGTTTIKSWKGAGAAAGSSIDSNTLPIFAGDASTAPLALRIEVVWDGDNDIGYQYNEVVFTPGENTVTESPDGLIVNANAQIYGDVTRITGFTSGYTSVHINT